VVFCFCGLIEFSEEYVADALVQTGIGRVDGEPRF
jgi:hypothetical protein